MNRDVLVFSIILVVLIGIGACIEPSPELDDLDRLSDPSDPIVFSFEVEDAVVDGIFVVGSDAGASAGRYLYQPSDVPNTHEPEVSARIPVSVDDPDDYTVWVRLFGLSTSEDAAYVGVDGSLTRVFPSTIGVYEWVEVGSWALDGTHELGFGHAESNTRIDLVVIANTVLSLSELDSYVVVPEEPVDPADDPEEPADNPSDSEPSEYDRAVVVSVSASTHDGNVPENTLDDDLDTRWSARGQGQFITFEFENTLYLDALGIAWHRGDERFANYEIQTSMDGVSWRTSSTGPTEELTLRHQNVSVQVDARHLRIIGYGNNENDWNSITSIHINGKNPDYAPTSESPSSVPEPSLSGIDYAPRANPDFSRGQLTAEQRERYDAFWYALENSNPDLESVSSHRNVYQLGRTFFLMMNSAQVVFRQTGDLELLDRMYELSKNSYDTLDDSWTSGTISPYYDTHIRKNLTSEDGFRNWRYLHSCTIGGTDRYCGRDNHRLEEALSHGNAAGIMYVLHANRDVESPKGYDYGELADAWLDYLRNDFEAKWRERYGIDWPQMPYFTRYFSHTNAAHLKTQYYVGRVLQDKGDSDARVYLDEAETMAEQIFTEPHVPSGSGEQAGGMLETQTPIGPAYIWAFGTPYNRGIHSVSATPSTYARYFLGMAAELHFDGAPRFEDVEVMRKLSRTVSHFMLDTDPPFGSTTQMIAADVIGGDGDGEVWVDGMQSTAYRSRMNANTYSISTFGLFGLWDDTGRIDEITTEVDRRASSSSSRLPLQSALFITNYDRDLSED